MVINNSHIDDFYPDENATLRSINADLQKRVEELESALSTRKGSWMAIADELQQEICRIKAMSLDEFAIMKHKAEYGCEAKTQPKGDNND